MPLCTPRTSISPFREGRGCMPRSCFSACCEGRGCTMGSCLSACHEGRGCMPRSCFSACREGRGCSPCGCLSPCREGRGCTLRSRFSACRASIVFFLWFAHDDFLLRTARRKVRCSSRRGGGFRFRLKKIVAFRGGSRTKRKRKSARTKSPRHHSPLKDARVRARARFSTPPSDDAFFPLCGFGTRFPRNTSQGCGSRGSASARKSGCHPY